MFAGSYAETGDERKAAAALPLHVIGNIQTAAVSYGARKRAYAGGSSLLWLTALTFAAIKELQAADPNVIFLDDGRITYKDLAHGSFELVTKEPIPRSFLVEDPGQTIVLRSQGSGVSVNQVTNSPARMAELQAAQQDALSTYEKGLGSSGSSSLPFADPLPVQPINFSGDDGFSSAQDPLPSLPSGAIFVPDFIVVGPPPPPPPPVPPVLNAVTGPIEVDTVAFDTFAVTGGTFVASSDSGVALTYGISGGIAGSTTRDGVTYDVSKTDAYGTLYVNSTTGAYIFVPDSDAINALTSPTTTSFSVTVSDGTLSAGQTFTIAINGTNDAAVISGATAGSAIEAGDVVAGAPAAPTATGTLTNTDVDNPHNAFTAIDSPTASKNGFGSFTMTAAGVWTYALNEASSAVQALNVGGTLTDSFTVTTVDGSAQTVAVIIHGANDGAVVSGATGGSATEAGGHEQPTATGTLTNTDVDNPDNAFTAIDSPTASENGFGSFTMTANGVWTYTLNEASSAVQALNVGGTLTDTFTVTTVDGTAQVVTVNIHGTNDGAVISGVTGGSATEAGGHEQPTATGTLTNTDVDNAPNTFTPVSSPTASAGGYGTFTMTTDGVWTYTLGEASSTVQALNVGDTLTDTFTVTTVDGTEQVVTVTIHGTNDAAVISGTTTGSVIEAACHEYGKPTATGTLTNSDVDNTPNSFNPVSSPEPSENGFGSFTMTADGVWTYTLDNTNGEVQALNNCDTLTDCFEVTTIDGTAQLVTVTIQGTNDAAVISGCTTGSVIEAGRRDCGEPTATGTLTATDVDNPHNSFTAVCSPEASAGGYGSFTMTADGVWTYMLDNDNCAVQALDSCDTLTDCFEVTTIDGTTQVVTIMIQGASDGHRFNWSGIADSFHFREEVSSVAGSNVIDPADGDFAQAAISQSEDVVEIGQLATSAEAQALAQSLSGQPADDNFKFALEPFASAAAFHAPHDLMV